MALLTGLDRRTIALGVVLQVALTLPPVLIVRAVTQDDVGSRSYLPVVAAVVALVVAPAGAGAFVSRAQPATPISHAAATTLLAWLLLAIVTVVRLGVGSEPILDALTVLPLFGLVEVGVGVATAHLAAPSQPRRREPNP